MDLTPDQIKKVKNFIWSDDTEHEDAIDQPHMEVCNEILECAEKVAEYVVENLNLLDLQQDLYSVNIPIETHPLLSARFDKQWTDYSRSRVFDFLRAVFIQKMDDLGYVEQLEAKIIEVFPRKNTLIRIDTIDFYDDPEVDITVTEREIDLIKGEESVKGEHSYRHSGNTVTVELKIDIIDDSEGHVKSCGV